MIKNNLLSNLKLVIKSRSVKLPIFKFPSVKTPPTSGVTPPSFNISLPLLPSFKMGKRIWLVVGGIAGVTIVVLGIGYAFIIPSIDINPTYPQAGVYSTSIAQSLGSTELTSGKQIDEFEQTQTLQLNVSGRVKEIKFSNMEIGGAGITTAIQISNTSGSGANIICEKLYINELIAPTFQLATSTAFTLNISTSTADGISFSPTLATVKNYVFGSNRGALNVPESKDSTIDRIIIDTGNASTTVGLISFEKVRVSEGGVDLQNLTCGTIEIHNSIIGDGSGISSASAKILSNVRTSNFSQSSNTEENISVK